MLFLSLQTDRHRSPLPTVYSTQYISRSNKWSRKSRRSLKRPLFHSDLVRHCLGTTQFPRTHAYTHTHTRRHTQSTVTLPRGVHHSSLFFPTVHIYVQPSTISHVIVTPFGVQQQRQRCTNKDKLGLESSPSENPSNQQRQLQTKATLAPFPDPIMMHSHILPRLLRASDSTCVPSTLIRHTVQRSVLTSHLTTTTAARPLHTSLYATVKHSHGLGACKSSGCSNKASGCSKRSLWIQAPTCSRGSSDLLLSGATSGTGSTAMRYSHLLLPTGIRSLRVATRRGFISQSEQRELDDVVSFYDDKVTQYANQEIQTVTLKTLLGLGRSGSSAATKKQGQMAQPIRDLEINLDVARYARKELPVRLARLIKATQKLPFIVGTNPYIKRVYKLYYDSFQVITSTPEEIRDKEDVDKLASLLQGLVASHADVIPMLSQGFQECKKYMPKEDIKNFLDGMIRARIGIRLIAEQVISLREQRDYSIESKEEGKAEANSQSPSPRDVVGVVHTELRPADLIKTCASFVQELCDINYGSSPEVIINGQTDTTFTYVPVHLEYILCELLKNALRATVEYSQKIGRSALDPHGRDGLKRHPSFAAGSDKHGSGNSAVIVNQDDDQDLTKRPNEFGHPPVEVTIAHGDHDVTIRIRDHGGGISREHFDAIFDYSFTTVNHESDDNGSMDAGAGDSPYGVDNIFKGVSRLAMQAGLGGPIAGLGFGLPLTRIYAQYFGGDMHLISLQGYGCDVFLKLKQIDETLEDLQI